MDKFLRLVGCGFVSLGLLAICSFYAQRIGAVLESNTRLGDLATWLGAIGTVFTLLMTIRLATQQQHRQNRERKDRALLVAGAFAKRIAHMKTAVEEVMTWLDASQAIDPDPAEFNYYADRLKQQRLWKVDEIEPLLPLRGDCAVHLAITADHILSCIHRLQNAGQIADRERRRESSSEILSMLINRIIALQHCHGICASETATFKFELF